MEEHGERCPDCGLDTLIVIEFGGGLAAECENCGYIDFAYNEEGEQADAR